LKKAVFNYEEETINQYQKLVDPGCAGSGQPGFLLLLFQDRPDRRWDLLIEQSFKKHLKIH